MSDKHANKGNSLRKQDHLKQAEQAAKLKAAKKLAAETAAPLGGIQETMKRPKK